MKEMTMQELLTLSETTIPNIIDIREHYLYERGSIPGAKNIPFRILRTMPEKYLLKEEVYYIFCENGFMSSRLKSILEKEGYQIMNVKDGYEAFERMKKMLK